MLYCPACMNDTLTIQPRGTVDIIINGMQRDTGRFLYNISKDSKDEIYDRFKDKLDDFFRWYSNFQNQETVSQVDIISADFKCENGCRLEIGFKASVIDVLIPSKVLNETLAELSEDFGIEVDL